MAAAHVLYEAGEVRSALSQYQQVYDIARQIHNHLLEYTGLMTYAYVGLESGRRPRSALRALKLALELGKPRNFMSFLLWRPDMLARLCSHALEAGTGRDFVSAIIRTHGLALDASQLALGDWPWPIRISTFGAFRLLRGGELLTFAGKAKAQKRPLDFLKVVIAHGGREVSEERVTEALWPRIDGDSAHRSFTSTLHRLRKLLGEDRALVLSEGKVSLDGRIVWVDTWAFEQTAARVEQELRRPREDLDRDRLERHCEQLIALYSGAFLGNEPDEPWCLPLRARHRFSRDIGEASRYLLQAEAPERAVDLLERALEADSVAEGLYRSLMQSYARLGRSGDAAETYNRCRRALQATLSAEPSAETRAIYDRILQPS
jgi:DNA-binding SARP family transcriptional activator